MTNLTSFIRKWHNKVLEDCGCSVSKEFHSFQVAFINQIRKIAANNGAEVVKASYGHYDMSCFIKKGENYLYISYSNSLDRLGRTHVILKGYNIGLLPPVLVRTAKDANDYHGGTNHFCQFNECEELIVQLFNNFELKF